MKIILVLILMFISSTFNSNTLKSSYSLLLDDIREDVIDTALLNLPTRGSVDILKMYLLMAEEKEKNSLNDAESAFLVYKWIAQNIKINCYYMYKKEQSDLEIAIICIKRNSQIWKFINQEKVILRLFLLYLIQCVLI